MKKSNSVAEKSKAFLEPIVSGLGYTLVDVDYEKKSTGYNLTVYIDSPNGISLNDCETVHRAIDEPLDELNPTNDAPYTLNVSSCGLDWAFRSNADYDRNIGKEIDISLYAPIEKKRAFTGTLIGYTDTTVTIQSTKQITIPREAIAKASKHIDF